MPARCWIAPEMPTARYSCGDTVLPVCPTWNWCGYQPASVAARDAPTAPPSVSASCSMSAKFSLPPTPRPPDTTICASVSSGRLDFSSVTRSTTWAALTDFLAIDTYPGDTTHGLAADPLATIAPLTSFAKGRGKTFGVAEFAVPAADAAADPAGAAAWI